jgi:phosphoglycerol transferase
MKAWAARHEISLEITFTALITLLCLSPILASSLPHLSSPWGAGDMTFYYFYSSVWEGWKHGFAESVAFPFGMDPNSFAGLDALPHVYAQAVNAAGGNPFIGLNSLLLLSFPIVAVGAWSALRLVGLRGPLAVALASAYTFIPFHFGRGIGHLHLGLLIGVTAGINLALIVGSGRLMFWCQSYTGWRRTRYILGVIALIFLSSWTGLYYAIFNVILVAVAVLWRFSQGDAFRKVLVTASVVLGQVLALLLGLLPILVSRFQAGDTSAVGMRDPIESVSYAGNFLVSVIPQPYSILSETYNQVIFKMFEAAPASEQNLMANFGSWVTSLALLVAIVGAFTQSRKQKSRETPPDTSESSSGIRAPIASMSQLITLAFVSILFFIPWGFNYLFAYLVSAQIRGWNRLLPYLLLLFILGAASALASWSWSSRGKSRWIVSICIIILAFVDMVLPWKHLYTYVPADGSTRLEQATVYSQKVNQAIPGDCGILTLPYVPFLNAGPLQGMDDYDHFLIAMTNPGKPISYGAYPGSAAAQVLSGFTETLTPQQANDLRYLGFCGVHVDEAGYEDPGPVLAHLTQILGPPVAEEGRWTMFSLKR